MKPPPFDYLAPGSLDETLGLLAEKGGEAKVLAGGQSLVPVLNFRLAQPTFLVDLNGVDELDYIEVEDDGSVRIGAMARQRRLELDTRVHGQVPLLAVTMPLIAHPQIRNRGTVGGSLAHADPSGELPVAAVALEAELVLRSHRGERTVPAADFCQGLMTTALAEDELLCELRVRATPRRTGWEFREIARRHGDYAHAGVAARLTLGDDGKISAARLVYLSAGEVPMSAVRACAILEGEQPSEELFAEAALTAGRDEVDPSDDIHATAAFKRHLAEALTRRVLATALDRAKVA
ncbi:MAG: xanthine dehydrogenase family protein subunit M [bacterium]|nr:xanthine dehydrogenase family protein subunit M [bacterium]